MLTAHRGAGHPRLTPASPGGGGESANSRRYPRIEDPFSVRVVEASGKSWTGEAVNLSPFGIKIREARIAPPAIVRLEFELPAGGARLTITAAAVRTDADGGAFAFINLARADFQRIRNAVESLFLRRKLWIMIVEDDPSVAAVLADFTEEHDCATFIIPSAEEALAYLTQDHPDAILLDLTLPGMSGLQLLDTLARQQLRIPVVVVPGLLETTTEPIRNLATGEVHVADVALPGGMEYKTAAVCRATVNRGTGPIAYDWPGSHSSLAHVEHTRVGLQR